jgi:hypothetical protein
MTRTRWTIARLMALIAIVAFDCWLVQSFLSTGGRRGMLGFWLPVSLGWLGILVGRGGLRRFSEGYTYIIVGSIVAFVVSGYFLPGIGFTMFEPLIRFVFRLLPGWLARMLPSAPPWAPVGGAVPPNFLQRAFVEFCVSLPVLALALPGGLLALAFGRRTPSTP